METAEVTQYWLTRFVIQRFLGFVYFIAFLIVVNQFNPLLGEKGLLPVRLFLNQVKFWDTPSLFWLNHSDRFFMVCGWAGVFLSILAVTGLSDRYGIYVSAAVWFLLWLLYLSFVNVGQIWYSFGWETLLLEIGFLAIFFGSSDIEPPQMIIWLFRWVLFRVMFGAGMIKMRGDECWRDLTCLNYHYETQPIPNPLSWYLHYSSEWSHKAGVLMTHFVQLAGPWLVFFPPPVCYVGGLLALGFQSLLIVSGNLSWLNYVTLVTCFACFDDRFLSKIIPIQIPQFTPFSPVHLGILYVFTGFILILSIPPALNLLSPRQAMNASFEPLHLVNTYGAFGSITKTRYEIILEGTEDVILSPATKWREYEFKAKPGNVKRAPPIISPYHLRLDWLMWFAAMSPYPYHPWILSLVAKLLEGEPMTLKLIAGNPFPGSKPHYIRALLYEYHFTTAEERKQTRAWWKRTYISDYLPPLSLDQQAFRRVLLQQGWLE